MYTKLKPGVKPKLSEDQKRDILNSKEKIKDLATQYKVHSDTIYRLFREKRKKLRYDVL